MSLPVVPVLFGTESGNAEYCAGSLAGALRKRGLDARAIDMEAFPPESLAEVSFAIFITSTYGNGDPPYNARALLEHLQTTRTHYPDLHFAVCGLGDSTFEMFAQCGRDFEAALLRVGATPLANRVDCDVDYDEDFEAFEDDAVAAFEKAVGEAPERAKAGAVAETPAERAVESRVFAAELLEKRRLSGHGSNKWTMHYTLDVSDAPQQYEVGDCFAVHPVNGRQQVDAMLTVMQLDGTELVEWQQLTLPLAEVLRRACLAHVETALLEGLAALGGDEGPAAVALRTGKDALRQYRADRDVFDVIFENAPAGVAAESVVPHLRKLAPRLYSVASSPARNPKTVDLTVETLRYQRRGRVMMGVASNELAVHRAVGDMVSVHLVPNEAFRFHVDVDAPLIMVGPGTGIAPFRGFLQHLECAGSGRPTWLFFGHQREPADFLYREEIRGWLESGVLHRADFAWSRMQATKVYVQHKIRERGADVWSWLARGAEVCVCGDAQGMEPGVVEALKSVAAQHGGVSDPDAWFEQLRAANRYRADVY